MQAEFYKTGPVTTGELAAGGLFDQRWNGNSGRVYVQLNNSIRFVNPAPTCDLAAGDVNRTIGLPTIRASALRDVSSAGASNFELTANCSNASSVTFRFTGTPASGDAARFANTGSARGVGLWLYSRVGGSNQTISNGNTRVVTVSGNRAVLPLGAAYWKNGTVTQGSLSSTTTVAITYN
jgi:type 1 fimbria pilin